MLMLKLSHYSGDKAKPLFHLLKHLKRFTLHKRMDVAEKNLYIVAKKK